MRLPIDSIEWAIKHIDKENDTDLFPKPFEINIIKEYIEFCKIELSKIEIGNYKWKPSRRFIIPKDEVSYRVITQLDPLDSFYLSAIIKEYGSKIEAKRVPVSEKRVFGNRFAPSSDGFLYKNDGQWKKYWKTIKTKSKRYKYIVKFDIADFYNQIYHHTIENQLIECGFPNEVKNAICNFLNIITLKVSRGIPVGPHSTHLIAELALIPIDNSLKLHGIEYCRYMDDFVAFCKTKQECQITLNKVAEILDKQQRLILQRHKTKIYEKNDFIIECENQLSFEPLNNIEEKILTIVKNNSDGPYLKKINWDDLDSDDKEFFSKIFYDDLIDSYLTTSEQPNFPKLRWIYRRLKQLGVPHAIEYSITNIDKLTPIINDVCEYLVSATPNYNGNIKRTGAKIHKVLDNPLIKSSEFFQIAIINVFSQTTDFNHFDRFSKKFSSASENVKRKILFFAFAINANDWLREIKEKYSDFNPWNKRAFLIASSSLPKDERKFFYENANLFLTNEDILEKLVIKWGKNK